METNILENSALIESVMLGRVEFFHSCSLYSPLSGADFLMLPNGTSLYASGINFAVCNGIMEESDALISEHDIDAAIDYFKIRNLPFIWWSDRQVFESKGFLPGGILTGMALEVIENAFIHESVDVVVKNVQTEEELQLFTELFVRAFGSLDGLGDQFLAVNRAAMDEKEQLHLIAYLGDEAVGVATLSTGPSTAGIWSLATLPEHRKKGVATALVRHAIAEAKVRQYAYVVAILMPKGMAWNVFENTGFIELCQFPFSIYGASAEELEKSSSQ